MASSNLKRDEQRKIKNNIYKLLVKFANTKLLKPIKPILVKIILKYDLFSIRSTKYETSSKTKNFKTILRYKDLVSDDFEPKNESDNIEITDELVREIRSHIDIGPSVLAIAHDNFTEKIGGIQTVMNLENRIIRRASGNYWSLNPVKSLSSFAFSPTLELLHNGKLIGQVETENISQLFKILKLDSNGLNRPLHIVLHSLLGHDPGKISEAIKVTDIESVHFYLHDFYSICPSIKLLRNDSDFCSGPKITSTSCKVCIYKDIRADHVSKINSIIQIPEVTLVAPSVSTHEIWKASSELAKNLIFAPHLQLTPVGSRTKRSNSRPKIAFFGPPHKEKGWQAFLSLYELLQESHEFFVFSSFDLHISGLTFRLLKNNLGEINHTRDLLLENEIDYAFIYPYWPETYSLVTTEAISAGVFVLTHSNSGNVASLVAEYDSGAEFEDLESMVNFLKSDIHANLNLRVYDAEFIGIVEKLARV